MIYPPPHIHIFLVRARGGSLFPQQIKARRKAFPEGPVQVSGNKRAGHSSAVPWDSRGRRVYLAAQHRVSSVLGPTGCSAPGWFCLPGQRQLLLEENPGTFDLRLRVSLSHLERGVQAWLPGDPPPTVKCPHPQVGLLVLQLPHQGLPNCTHKINHPARPKA